MDYPTDLIPPEDIWIAFGGGDFQAMGEKLLRQFIEYADLKSDERVLDVGCGAGRAAVPLTAYLGEKGSYRGFDTYPFGVNWCREHITPRHPRFVFELADVYNQLYNPYGQTPASQYRFPYEDDSFDFIIASSVFTHMLPADMTRYFSEMARVLSPGGRAFITYYLLGEQSKALLAMGGPNRRWRIATAFFTSTTRRPWKTPWATRKVSCAPCTPASGSRSVRWSLVPGAGAQAWTTARTLLSR